MKPDTGGARRQAESSRTPSMTTGSLDSTARTCKRPLSDRAGMVLVSTAPPSSVAGAGAAARSARRTAVMSPAGDEDRRGTLPLHEIVERGDVRIDHLAKLAEPRFQLFRKVGEPRAGAVGRLVVLLFDGTVQIDELVVELPGVVDGVLTARRLRLGELLLDRGELYREGVGRFGHFVILHPLGDRLGLGSDVANPPQRVVGFGDPIAELDEQVELILEVGLGDIEVRVLA